MSKKGTGKGTGKSREKSAMTKVLVNFIQDRSGSMQSAWDETLSGFKKFVEDLKEGGKKDNIDYMFSLTTFDTVIDTPLVSVPVDDVDTGILSKHGPRGMTALYDAVGATITNTETDSHGADKIITVIVTDGHENSSREWDKDRLQKSIEAKLLLGNWTFTYLGTQPETWGDAGAIGVGVGAVASYTPAMANMAYAATAHAVNSLSASCSMGTRSLMSTHVPQRMARAAGMTVRSTTKIPGRAVQSRPHPSPVSQRPSPSSVTGLGTRRWR